MRDHVDPDAVAALTAALVRIDTRNPPGNERAAVATARDALSRFGARFEEVEVEGGRTSLVATIGAHDGSRPVLLVNGHLDVVPVDASGWTREPFAGEVAEGRVWGRGAADMKGGIAAAIEALATLRRAGQPAPDLAFHLVADEERGGALGTAVLAARGMVKADACLVPEPTSLAIGVAERGLLVGRIVLHGRPAHASEPGRGVSAIEKAAKVVLALHNVDLGESHALLGSPTVNAGTISGGSGHNTVAEECEVVVDRRILPGATREQVETDLRSRIDAIGDPDLLYDLQVTMFGEASELDVAHPFVDRVQQSMEAVLGARAPVIGMPFTTDARFVRNQAGVPAVVCGPGALEQAHVHDESVEVDRLVDAAAVYAHLYASFA